MKVTQADLDFWNSRRLPRWALQLKAEQKAKRWWRETPPIHYVINSHAGIRSQSYEMSAHNLCNIVRSMLRRQENIRGELARMARAPGTVINPQQRARFARKWLARLG